jgi:alginate O-acetyltransferase complex protein AlgI
VHSTSAAYFLFIIIVLLAYWLASGWRFARLSVLLAANYFFCARYGLFYLALIPACSTIDYLAGRGMQWFQNSAVRRLFLGLSLIANLALLVLSRHMTLFLQPSVWDWVFPLSLSFYAFQSLSYTIDIYRQDATAASSYLGYMAAASFFPTIQAGPITRPAEVLKQITRKFELTPADGSRALFLIVFGLLKKLLIADYLAGNLVNRVFDTPNLYSGAENLAAVYVYSLALYYDFSGYTDIARGCGLLLGVRLPINFDRPYARSLTGCATISTFHCPASARASGPTSIWSSPWFWVDSGMAPLGRLPFGASCTAAPWQSLGGGKPGVDAVPKAALPRAPFASFALTSLSVSPGCSSAARPRPLP